MNNHRCPTRVELIKFADGKILWIKTQPLENLPPDYFDQLIDCVSVYRWAGLSCLARDTLLLAAHYAGEFGDSERANAAKEQAEAISIPPVFGEEDEQ